MLTYVLITTSKGNTPIIVDEIKRLGQQVREVSYLYGQYDLLVRMTFPSQIFLNKTLRSLREIRGVRSVQCLIAKDKTKENDIVPKY